MGLAAPILRAVPPAFSLLTRILTGLVAVLHVLFFVIEMFLWDHPVGRKIFSMTPEVSASSAPLAMQQALYNGFLVAGLVWGLKAKRKDLLTFFLICVIAAGVFAALTVKTSIFFTQALPAILALLSLRLIKPRS